MSQSRTPSARRSRLVRRLALRPLAAVAIVVAVLSSFVVPSDARPSPRASASEPTIGPLVAGTASYVDGTFVWTDYVLDDRGPNLSEVPVLGPVRCSGPGAPDCSGGDAVYPAWAAPGNAADLVQLQLSKTGQRLAIRAVLGTLVDPDLPILGVAFDSDADPATGAAALPGGRWPATDPLGVDTLVVVSSDGARVWSYDGAAWAAGAAPSSHVSGGVDPETNSMDAAVHQQLLPAMTGSWRAFGVLGIRNADGGSWLDGSEEIYDLAFVGDEPFVRWQDNRQADVLAGPRAPTHEGLSSTAAAAVLDFDKLGRRVTDLVDPSSPGFHTYLFRSQLDLPEGTRQVGSAFEYLGRYQPYLVYVPENPPAGNPLMVSLHGANNNHLQSIFQPPVGYVGTARAGSEDPYLVAQFQPDFTAVPVLPKTLVIYPLGRGETLGYRGISELDVLEATADAVARLEVDPNRITLQGASMGGSGAYHLAVARPDMWAAVIPLISSGAAVRNLFENLVNVPVRQQNGIFDSGSAGAPSELDAMRLDELGYDHKYWLLQDRGHEVPAYVTCVFDETTMSAVRDPNPARVVYTVEPSRFFSDPARGIDIRYDSAYWVQGITTRDGTGGTVDALSSARPRSADTAVRSNQVGGNTDEGRDLCGPNPVYAPGWSPVHPDGETWLERSLVLEKGAALPTANELDVTLTNVGTVTLDLARAGFERRAPGVVRVQTDGHTLVTLRGLPRGVKAGVGGRSMPATTSDGSFSFDLPEGSHQITIRP